jgi:hypothetical protein
MADFPLAFGLSRAYFVPLAPDAQPRGVPDIVGPFTAAFSQRGIVSDWPFAGKRKVYEGSVRHAHYTNSFSTSTKIVQFAHTCCMCPLIFAEKRKFTKFLGAEKIPRKYCKINQACGKRSLNKNLFCVQRASGRANS